MTLRAADDFGAIKKRMEQLRNAAVEPEDRVWCVECGTYGGTHSEGCRNGEPSK